MSMNLNLRPHLFWDVDFNALDEEKNKRLIIERVLNRGTIDEFKQILSYYGEENIKGIVVNIRALDNKTLEFVHSFFHIPKEKFKCYTTKLLNQEH
jgi:hypothetical protein